MILRPFELTDAEAIQRYAGDPDVATSTISIPHPYPDAAAEEFIAFTKEAAVAGRSCTFGVVRKEDGALIGSISISGLHTAHRKGELGYWIGRPFWGQGYATEASEALLKFCFEQLALNKVFARFMTRNPASGKVMQKIGMTHEGILRQGVLKYGVYEDLRVYSILRSEYESRK